MAWNMILLHDRRDKYFWGPFIWTYKNTLTEQISVRIDRLECDTPKCQTEYNSDTERSIKFQFIKYIFTVYWSLF